MLGATLYMPATRNDLADVIIRNKIPGLRSLVICLEDAVSEEDIPKGLENLQAILAELAEPANILNRHKIPLVFIRPRHEAMAADLVKNFPPSAVDGLVLPKFTENSLPVWWEIVAGTSLNLMPTLETADVFDVQKMTSLASVLEQHPVRERIVAIRIGGNDLMSVISMRHPRDQTLYDTPMGYVVKMLVAVFASRGFSLTAPVCEQIENTELLLRELALDVSHGLVGKTAIHPSHLEIIHNALMVDQDEYNDALCILNSSQAIFKSQGAMCEPATHRRWASSVLERARHCGITKQYDKFYFASRH